MKRLLSLMLTLLLTAGLLLPCAKAEDTVLEPLWHVPDYVQWLLDVARGEIGYKEGPHGYSKYGEWAGDAYAQWCAEFLCCASIRWISSTARNCSAMSTPCIPGRTSGATGSSGRDGTSPATAIWRTGDTSG